MGRSASKVHNIQDIPSTVVVLTSDFGVTEALFNSMVIPVTVFTSIHIKAFVAPYGIEIDLDTTDAEDTLREVNTRIPGKWFAKVQTVSGP